MPRLRLASENPRPAFLFSLGLSVLLIGVLAPAAFGREAYVVNEGSSDVSVIDTATNQTVGTPIKVGESPFGLAITPDGKAVYVVNFGSESVSVINAQTKQLVGAPIKVGQGPAAIAITPNGRFAYIANYTSNDVSVIDTATNQTVGSPIEVGTRPEGIAITPDGRFVYVVNQTANDVSVTDTATNQVVGAPIKVGDNPEAIAFTPDGRFAYVTNEDEESVSVIDTQTKQVVGPPVKVGQEPLAIAIGPEGRFAYVADAGSNDVSVISATTNQTVGSPIEVGASPYGIAASPDGRSVYVANEGSKSVSVISTQTNQTVGPPITVGEDPYEPAVVPDQPPLASLSVHRARPGVQTTLSAAGSSDPDGTIGRYEWDFGDGLKASGTAAEIKHAYAKPGVYMVGLTLIDSEGCSTMLIFTAQTAFCNGSAAASKTATITVAYPAVRVRCPKSAKPGGCTFALQAITKKSKGKAQSAVAKARVKAGKAATVSLKPKQKFSAQLASAKQILVRKTVTIAGVKRTSVRKLKVVG